MRNESKNLFRMLSSCRYFVDAFCVVDTGSTDNSIEECDTILKSFEKPYKIYQDEWINFGKNRTDSFHYCVELCNSLQWDTKQTYGITLDCDMVLCINKEFEFTKPCYLLYQCTQNSEYPNIRIMSLNYKWECIGPTHEYWLNKQSNIQEYIPIEYMYIEDLNDGGFKSNKFQRDIELLSNDLKYNENNARTTFYLAQSYYDIGEYNNAIEYYIKRIQLKGWTEEVWYSYYKIMKSYYYLKDYANMDYYGLMAYVYDTSRAENIYFLTTIFRQLHQYDKANIYMNLGKHISKPLDKHLFIETNVYEYAFPYENTLIKYYVDMNKKNGLIDCILYINQHSYQRDSVYSNLHYYIEYLYIWNKEELDHTLFSMIEYKNNIYKFSKVKDDIQLKVGQNTYKYSLDGNLTDTFITNDKLYLLINHTDLYYLDHTMTPMFQSSLVNKIIPISHEEEEIYGLETLYPFKVKDEIVQTPFFFQYLIPYSNIIIYNNNYMILAKGIIETHCNYYVFIRFDIHTFKPICYSIPFLLQMDSTCFLQNIREQLYIYITEPQTSTTIFSCNCDDLQWIQI